VIATSTIRVPVDKHQKCSNLKKKDRRDATEQTGHVEAELN
jgi:hypothetical protein